MSAQPRPQLAFRPMQMADIERISAAEQGIYSFPWTLGNFTDSLAAGHQGWICHDPRGLVGYAVMMVVLDEVHLLNISIVPERQGHGLGGALLEFLMEEARTAGILRMFLEVRPSNVQAVALYLDEGFCEVGTRRGYYPAAIGREDALVMARTLV